LAKRLFELSASGIDDQLVGMSSSPWGGTPEGAGLRIPPVPTTDTGDPALRPRYLFCLATRTTHAPTTLIGCRQGLTLGCDLNEGDAPFRPIELQVTTPDWKFVDGNVSWHIVKERNARPRNQRPLTDTQNWSQTWSDGPAMLYQTFTNAFVNANGAPVLYMRGLETYTPPPTQGVWLPVAEDLKSFYDIRFPQTASQAWNAFGPGIPIETGERITFYASVLQTNPATRSTNTDFFNDTGLPPEEAFLQILTPTAGEPPPLQYAPVYWRIFGSLIFADEV
jgi:hypothetical protein